MPELILISEQTQSCCNMIMKLLQRFSIQTCQKCPSILCECSYICIGFFDSSLEQTYLQNSKISFGSSCEYACIAYGM